MGERHVVILTARVYRVPGDLGLSGAHPLCKGMRITASSDLQGLLCLVMNDCETTGGRGRAGVN